MYNESTPLTSNVRNTASRLSRFIPIHETRHLFQNVLFPRQEQFQTVGVSDRLADIRFDIRQRFGIRLIAYAVAVLLVVSSFLEGISNFLAFQFSGAFLEALSFLMGATLFLLESQQGRLPDAAGSVRLICFKYAPFLQFAWGRGCLFLVAAWVEVAQDEWNDWLTGLACFVVGIWYLVVSRKTGKKLQQLREFLISEAIMRSTFEEIDIDKKNELTAEQFQIMTVRLGVHWSRQECEAAILYMDQRHVNESVSFDDFHCWWQNWPVHATRFSSNSDGFIIV